MILTNNAISMPVSYEPYILKAEQLVTDMAYQVEKYTKLLELAKKDRVETVKNYVRYSYMTRQLVRDARQYLTDKKNKNFKTSFKLVNDFVNNVIGKTVEINEIMECGWEGYAYSFYFDYNDHCFQLTVPVIENLNEKNFFNADYGRLCLTYEHQESIYDTVASSYKEEDIKEAFEKFNTPIPV